MISEHDVAVLAHNHDAPVDRSDSLDQAQVAPDAPRYAESSSFGLPGWMMGILLGSYALFFAALALATARDGYTIFAVIISVLYAFMFFGTSAVLEGLGKQQTKGIKGNKGSFDTWTGPMNTASVAAQVLTVPILFALFALAIVIMRSVIGF